MASWRSRAAEEEDRTVERPAVALAEDDDVTALPTSGVLNRATDLLSRVRRLSGDEPER